MSGLEVAGLLLGAISLASQIAAAGHAMLKRRHLRDAAFEMRADLGRLEDILEACEKRDLISSSGDCSQLYRIKQKLVMISERGREYVGMKRRAWSISGAGGHTLDQLGRTGPILQSDAEVCSTAEKIKTSLAMILKTAYGDLGAERETRSSNPLLDYLFNPSPTQFIIAFTLLCVFLALLYRRRPDDRHKNGIVAAFVSIACFVGWLAGDGMIGILLKWLPSTILVALLASEAAHRTLWYRDEQRHDIEEECCDNEKGVEISWQG